MSEYNAQAYYCDRQKIATVIGSNNTSLMDEVISDTSGRLSQYANRFTSSKKSLSEAVRDIFLGTIEDNLPFHYSFAILIIISHIANKQLPDICQSPFVDLDNWSKTLTKTNSYPLLANIFGALGGYGTNEFHVPVAYHNWAPRPGLVWLDLPTLEGLVPEIAQMKTDITNYEKSFTSSDQESVITPSWIQLLEDECFEILPLLSMLTQALGDQQEICIAYDGDL